MLLLRRQHCQLVHGGEASDLPLLQALKHALGPLPEAVQHDGRGRILLDLITQTAEEVVDLALVWSLLVPERLEAL